MTSKSQIQQPRRRSRLIACLAIASALTAVLAGCSVPRLPAATSAPPVTQPTQAASAPGPANPSQAAPSATGEPVATRNATVSATAGNFQVAFDLFALRRTGDVVTLNARMRVLSAPEPSDGYPPAGAVTILSATDPDVLGRAVPDGLALIDGEAELRYLPALDDEGKAMCSPFLPARWSTGDEIYVSCVFGAPKSSTVTVDAVTFGSIPDVAVE